MTPAATNPSATTPLIDIAALCFAYPGAPADCLAIDALQVDAGESVFLYGPSGSGKSTLLGLLAGVLVAREGRVAVLGHDWARLRAARRDALRADHIGYVFQQFNLLPWLSARDNVLLACRFSTLRAQRTLREGAGSLADAADRLLDAMGLNADARTRAARTLSVGQQQRVAAARALIGSPGLVIADEPTSALDADRRDAFMDLMQSACRAAGSTLVFVSHDERLAERFDRRVSLPALNHAAGSLPAEARA